MGAAVGAQAGGGGDVGGDRWGVQLAYGAKEGWMTIADEKGKTMKQNCDCAERPLGTNQCPGCQAAKGKAEKPFPRPPCCASLIVHHPTDLPKCDGEILVALWGCHEWEIVRVRENCGGLFTAEYKSTGELADPSEWKWWADLHCMILRNR